MKLFILSLFVALACGAQDTNLITKVSERDRDKDGKPDYRLESVYRGNSRVMMVSSKLNSQGTWMVQSRAFYIGSEMPAIETDENGDGFFETLAVYRDGQKDMEVFTRQRDGSVSPVSTQTLQAHKKANAAITEFWENAFTTNTNYDVENAVRETRKKIQEAEREKADEKK